MASQQDIIKGLVSSLDNTSLSGTSALDEAVVSVSKFSSWQNLIDTMISDAAVYEGHSDDFLQDMCGIVLDNEDTGAITGSDAGGDTTKTAESVVPESGDWSYPSSTLTTINGVTIQWPNSSSLSDTEKWVIGALYSWWIPSALTLANSSYGLNFNNSGVTVKNIKVQLYSSSAATLASTSSTVSAQKTADLTLKINMSHYSDIDQTNSNGSSSGADLYLDRTIAHEITHAVMAANIDYFYELPRIFTEGIAELTHGIDDRRKDAISSLGNSSYSLKSAINGNSSTSNLYASGYMLLRYLAKQASNDRDPSVAVTYDSSSDTSTTTETTTTDTTNTTETETSSTTTLFVIEDNTMSVSADFTDEIWLNGFSLFNGESSSYGNDDIVSVDASAMTSSGIIAGNSQSNYIQAGSGGAQMWGGFEGDDTLCGGDDADTFWFGIGSCEMGSDVINNFSSEDILVIYDLSMDAITGFEHNDNKIVAKFNTGSELTINTTGDSSTFQLGDGSKWKYNHSDRSWSGV